MVYISSRIIHQPPLQQKLKILDLFQTRFAIHRFIYIYIQTAIIERRKLDLFRTRYRMKLFLGNVGVPFLPKQTTCAVVFEAASYPCHAASEENLHTCCVITPPTPHPLSPPPPPPKPVDTLNQPHAHRSKIKSELFWNTR
jgi:hypothetical protein